MKREICETCTRPKNVCYCDQIIKIDNKITLIILQHPDEKEHSLNTAQMTHLSFKNSFLFTGESFDHSEKLKTILKNKRVAILYPHETSHSINDHSKNHYDALIVLDGTWRKAKRIFNETKLLHNFPFIKLSGEYKSIYKIRKAPNENYLSTLEASTFALNELEGKNYTDAIHVLESQIRKHIDFMGPTKFKKFYNN